MMKLPLMLRDDPSSPCLIVLFCFVGDLASFACFLFFHDDVAREAIVI